MRALQAAGLVNDLDSSSSAITVFAPTDDAFAALAAALNLTPEDLLSKSDLLSVVQQRLQNLQQCLCKVLFRK